MLTKGLSIMLIFSKNQLFDSMILCLDFFGLDLIDLALIFIVSLCQQVWVWFVLVFLGA
jgi:hypothetical protein